MAPPKRPWFRFYVDTFRNMNVRVMPYAQRWAWAAVLGMARESPLAGVLLSENDLPLTEAYMAEYAAMKPTEMRAAVRKFHELGMLRLDIDTGALVVVKWDERQFESDNVTERTAKHRRRNVPSNDDATADETVSPSEGPEVQRFVDSSSSSPTLVGPVPADEDRCIAACRVLARRDLERVEADKGARNDPDAWLATAADRRWTRHVDQAEAALKAHPEWTVDELAAFLDPPVTEQARPHPLDEAQRAQRLTAEREGQKWRDELAAIPEPTDAERERVRSLIAARKPA